MLTRYLLFSSVFASACWAACENPASFKKCVAQTRAEVNICGINMTCKCLRQEYVVRCYEKCGDDEYYQRMMEGEKGQQQIFCSQKKAGEPEDMPIIGSDTTAAEPAKKPPPQKPKGMPGAQPKPAKPQQPPKDESKEQDGVAGEGQYEDLGAGSNLAHGGSLGSNSGSIRSDGGYGRVIRNVDMEGRASALVGTGLVWAAAAAIHLVLAP